MMKVKSFDRREELIEAALDEFGAKSYEEASLNSIIKNAGISKGSFYYHFQDKQALYLFLLQAMADAKVEFVERGLADHLRGEEANLFENLKLQVRIGIEFAKNYPKYYLLGLMFLKEKGNDIYKVAMDSLNDTTERYFEDLIEKAVRHGDIRSGISEHFAAKVVAYLLVRFDELFDFRSGDISFDEVVDGLDSLIDFMKHGLGSRGTLD